MILIPRSLPVSLPPGSHVAVCPFPASVDRTHGSQDTNCDPGSGPGYVVEVNDLNNPLRGSTQNISVSHNTFACVRHNDLSTQIVIGNNVGPIHSPTKKIIFDLSS